MKRSRAIQLLIEYLHATPELEDKNPLDLRDLSAHILEYLEKHIAMLPPLNNDWTKDEITKYDQSVIDGYHYWDDESGDLDGTSPP